MSDVLDYLDLEEYQQGEQFYQWGIAAEDIWSKLYNTEYVDCENDDDKWMINNDGVEEYEEQEIPGNVPLVEVEEEEVNNDVNYVE